MRLVISDSVKKNEVIESYIQENNLEESRHSISWGNTSANKYSEPKQCTEKKETIRKTEEEKEKRGGRVGI